jgi:cytochrome P450
VTFSGSILLDFLAPVAVACASLAWAAHGPLRATFSTRFARAYPAVSTKLRWLCVLALALVGLLGWLVPQALWLVAVAALLLGCFDRWRGRQSFGYKRGWPPGGLAIFPASWADDRFYLEQARTHGTLFKTSHFFRPTACVVGLKDGAELLRDHADALEAPYLPFSRFVPGGMLRYMREPQHNHYRTIFRNVFSLNVTRRFEQVFQEHTRLALQRLQSDSMANPGGTVPTPHTARLMLEMWLQLFFAVEPGSEESRRLLGLYPVIDITNPLRASAASIRSAVAEIQQIVIPRLSASAEPLPCLWSAVREQNADDATDPVVIGNLIYMLSTTASDMSALLNWLLKKACEHPEWLERVAAECAVTPGNPPKSLAECFVLETLRMRQSEFIYRAVLRDIDFGGFRIPRGWLLRICVWESHRDPRVFDQPDQFNPGRFLGRNFSRDEFSPFGLASHACLATFLVTSVATAFVKALAVRYRIACPTSSPVVLAATRHWAPGPDFRIQLQART